MNLRSPFGGDSSRNRDSIEELFRRLRSLTFLSGKVLNVELTSSGDTAIAHSLNRTPKGVVFLALRSGGSLTGGQVVETTRDEKFITLNNPHSRDVFATILVW